MTRPRSPRPRTFDPLRVLGVRDDATLHEVRRAFRRAALRHHPDRNPGDPNAASRFLEARAAYEELLSRAGRPRVERPAQPPRERPLRVRCVLVGADLVGELPAIAGEPGGWIALELLAARTCPSCLGEGHRDEPRPLLFGALFVRTERIECEDCDGIGLLRVERRVRVRVPEAPVSALRLRERGVDVAGRRGHAILRLG